MKIELKLEHLIAIGVMCVLSLLTMIGLGIWAVRSWQVQLREATLPVLTVATCNRRHQDPHQLRQLHQLPNCPGTSASRWW